MYTSPRKGSGRYGLRSPRKNDTLELTTAKLRSPAKRSMRELNQLAYENAINNQPVVDDTTDAVAQNELTIINEIIRLSKVDGLDPLDLAVEEEEEEEVIKEEIKNTKATYNSPPREHLPSRKLFDRHLSEDNSDNYINSQNDDDKNVFNDTKIADEDDFTDLINSDKPSRIKKSLGQSLKETIGDEIPALNKEMKADTRADQSPFTTPIKLEFGDMTLPRSARKRRPPPIPETNIEELTPRSRKRRTLYSTFNDIESLKPPNFNKIELMDIPKVETDNDDLLLTDKKKKNKALYHDGYDAYFEQNQTRSRISKNSMTMAPDLDYEHFNRYNKLLRLVCEKPVQSLYSFYQFQYSQWLFELEEGFNLAFYGIGSKRRLLIEFLQDFVLPSKPKAKCIVVNGYNSEFTLRAFLKDIWRICFQKPLPITREIRETCNLTQIEFMKPKYRNVRLYLLLNNIDGDALRNDDLQFILSEIAKIPQVLSLCSLDNLVTPVFWDAAVLSSFNFIWHNVSTFGDYTTEITFKDPLSIGRTDEIVGSRGAKYVLSSLTGNAKSLYKHLVLQQLEKIDAFIGEDTKMLENRGLMKGSHKSFIPLREFYELCVSEFIISNDISFRTILGEFVEHKMCTLTRDTSGVEILFISFTVDELEKLLDEELID